MTHLTHIVSEFVLFGAGARERLVGLAFVEFGDGGFLDVDVLWVAGVLWFAVAAEESACEDYGCFGMAPAASFRLCAVYHIAGTDKEHALLAFGERHLRLLEGLEAIYPLWRGRG